VLPGCVPWPEEFARRYRERGYWRGISLFEMLRQSAARTPGKTALIDGDRRLSYAELVGESEVLAAGLYTLGLRPLERVIFQFSNGLELAVAFFALLRAGVIPVMALPAHRGSEIGHWVEHAGAVAHFIPGATAKFDYVAMARGVAAAHPLIRHVVTAGPAGEGVTALEELRARELLVQRWVLRHVAEEGPHRQGVARDVAAVDERAPAVRAEEGHEDLHHRRLPGAVRAEEAEDLAGTDLEVHGVDGGHVPVALRELGGAEHGDSTAEAALKS